MFPPWRWNRGRRIRAWLESWLEPLSDERRQYCTQRLLEADVRTAALIADCETRGLVHLADQIDWLKNEALRRFLAETRPVVLAFSHLGSPMAVGPSLAKIGVGAQLLHGGGAMARVRDAGLAELSPKLEYQQLGKDCETNALALMNGLKRLRGGGIVGSAVDAFDLKADRHLPYLGCKMPMGKGVAYLARRSGAVVVPILCSWTTTWRIRAEVGPAIEPTLAGEQGDLELTARILEWFDRKVACEPEQVRLRHFERFLCPPTRLGSAARAQSLHQRSVFIWRLMSSRKASSG